VTTVGIVFVTGGTGCRSSFARHPAEGATAAAETATTASARQPSKQLRRAVSYPLSQRQCRRVQQTARSCKDIFVIRNWRRLTGCIHSCDAADLHVLGNRVSRVTRSTILFQPVADTGLDMTPRPGQASRTDQWPVASCRRARQRWESHTGTIAGRSVRVTDCPPKSATWFQTMIPVTKGGLAVRQDPSRRSIPPRTGCGLAVVIAKFARGQGGPAPRWNLSRLSSAPGRLRRPGRRARMVATGTGRRA
jgi:hypothetical protein